MSEAIRNDRIVLCAAASLLVALCAGCGGPSDGDYAERMADEHRGDVPVASGAAEAGPAAEVATEEVVYAEVEGRPVRGYLAWPAAGAEGRPAVIVIQEWWGLNDNIRSMARRLAGEGYVALAVDLYEGRVAEDAEAARALMSASMQREPALEENLRQAWAFLAETKGAPSVGVIGWCFGGGWSLRTALMLPGRIAAAVIYYGRLVTDPERLKALEAPVLGIFGALDGGIPVESVREFESALAGLGKPASIHVYEGADHAFANPSGTRYDAEAAEDAWARTLAFLAEHLKADAS